MNTSPCPFNKVALKSVVDEQELLFSDECEQANAWHWEGDPAVDHTSPLDMCKVVALCPEACQRWRDGDQEELSFWFGCAPTRY